jgi:hypothetical protein
MKIQIRRWYRDFAILQICCAIHNNFLGLIFTTLFTISLLLGGLIFYRYYKRYHRFGQNLHMLEYHVILEPRFHYRYIADTRNREALVISLKYLRF